MLHFSFAQDVSPKETDQHLRRHLITRKSGPLKKNLHIKTDIQEKINCETD